MYTSSKFNEKEIIKTAPFMVAPRKIKYLGINLKKEVKELCKENYSEKEIAKDIRKRKDVSALV